MAMNIGRICGSCAEELGGNFPDGHLATWQTAECDVCGEIKTVTEPRDYRLTSEGKIAKPVTLVDLFIYEALHGED